MDGRIEDIDDDVAGRLQFNPQIYMITRNAPKSKVVQCSEEFARSADYPPQYRAAREYHGLITREQTDCLLGNVEGAYLVRASRRESSQLSFTLAFRLFDTTKNYKLKFDSKANVHYLEDGGPDTRNYNSVSDMVDDALITYYVESRAADILGRINKGDFTETGEYASRLDRLDRAAGSRYWTYGCAQHQQQKAMGKASLTSHSAVSKPLHSHSQSPKTHIGLRSHVYGYGHSHNRRDAGNSVVPNEPVAAFRPIAPESDSPNSQSHSHSPSNASVDGSPLRSTRTAPSGSVQPGGVVAPLNRYVPTTDYESVLYESDEPDTSRPSPSSDNIASRLPPRQSNYEPLTTSTSDTFENNLVIALEYEDESIDGRTAFELSLTRDKPHAFAMHTFAGAHFCDFCTHFLWGIIQQGVKCRDCGFKAHKQCALKVPPDCVPAMKHLRRLFGAELTAAALIQPSEKQRLLFSARYTNAQGLSASPSNSLSNKNALVSGVPFVVQQCVREVETRGMHYEGLYRIPGNHDDVEALKVAYDRDEPVDLSKVEEVHTVTSVLKNYFRSLPIPLISYEAYDDFIAAVRSISQSVATPSTVREQLRDAIARLAPVHRCTLEYLIRHLARVTDYQPKNMMSAENLSIVFAPTLMRSHNTDPVDSLNNLRFERLVIQRLISDFRELFAVNYPAGQSQSATAVMLPSPRESAAKMISRQSDDSPKFQHGSANGNSGRRDSCPQAVAIAPHSFSVASFGASSPQLPPPPLPAPAPTSLNMQIPRMRSAIVTSASSNTGAGNCDNRSQASSDNMIEIGAVMPAQVAVAPPAAQVGSLVQNRGEWDEADAARLSLFRAV